MSKRSLHYAQQPPEYYNRIKAYNVQMSNSRDSRSNKMSTTLWTEKTHQNVSWYTDMTDCNKIWHILSWVNLSYRNVNVFCLTWIVSVLYLVKLGIHVLQVNSSYSFEPKNTPKCFCHIFYKTRPILIRFGTCFPDKICHKVMSK